LKGDRLLTAAEVGRWLGINQMVVYELAQRGDLPFLRLGARRLRFRPADVNRWLDERIGLPPRRRDLELDEEMGARE
jgi:excisionase family DNA binding protein